MKLKALKILTITAVLTTSAAAEQWSQIEVISHLDLPSKSYLPKFGGRFKALKDLKNIGAIYIKKGRLQIVLVKERMQREHIRFSKIPKKFIFDEIDIKIKDKK